MTFTWKRTTSEYVATQLRVGNRFSPRKLIRFYGSHVGIQGDNDYMDETDGQANAGKCPKERPLTNARNQRNAPDPGRENQNAKAETHFL